jgi:hypothetical protein
VGSKGVSLGNSMFLCTADGQAVDGFRERFLGIWLDHWKKMPEAVRTPGAINIEERGPYKETPRNPRLPAGGMVLKAYLRALDKNPSGEFFAPEKLGLGAAKTVVKAEPNRDFLWLKPDEWKAMVPAGAKVGDRVQVPASVRDRLFRFHLVDGACCLPSFHRPGDVRGGELVLTVQEVAPGAVTLRLRGSATLGAKSPYQEFDLAGVAVIDPARAAFTRFDVVALSRAPIHVEGATGKNQWLGIAFELGRPEAPADCRVPYRVWYDQDGLMDYLGG